MCPHRLWRDIILSDSGKFWRWANLRVDYLSQYSVINSRMLYIVPAIKISWNTSLGMVESLLQAVSEGETPVLKQISATALTQVSPEILAGAAAKLERLRVDHLSSTQLKFILAKIAGHHTKLRKLSCCFPRPSLSGMDPDILAEAVIRLEIGNFLPDHLSPAQELSLFSKIKDSPDLRLTELSHSLSSNINIVPPEVFAGAVSRLESAELSSRVTSDQLEALFRMLISHQAGAGDPVLKQLKLLSPSLTSPEVLVGAIQRLEKVVFSRRITAAQITAVLLTVINNKQGRLKDIEFQLLWFEDFVPPNLSTLMLLARQNNAVRIKWDEGMLES